MLEQYTLSVIGYLLYNELQSNRKNLFLYLINIKTSIFKRKTVRRECDFDLLIATNKSEYKVQLSANILI